MVVTNMKCGNKLLHWRCSVGNSSTGQPRSPQRAQKGPHTDYHAKGLGQPSVRFPYTTQCTQGCPARALTKLISPWGPLNRICLQDFRPQLVQPQSTQDANMNTNELLGHDVLAYDPEKGSTSGQTWPVHQSICTPGAKVSSLNVCFDLPVQQPGVADNSPPHVPSVNIHPSLPPATNLLPTCRTIVAAKHTDKEKQGPIYQRPNSSSFIGDKKRTAVHLSFAETGKTGIRAQLAAGS